MSLFSLLTSSPVMVFLSSAGLSRSDAEVRQVPQEPLEELRRDERIEPAASWAAETGIWYRFASETGLVPGRAAVVPVELAAVVLHPFVHLQGIHHGRPKVRPGMFLSSLSRNPRSREMKCPTTTAPSQNRRKSSITAAMVGQLLASVGVMPWTTMLAT